MLSKSTGVGLVIVLALAGGAYWWTVRQRDEPLTVLEDAYPPGRWSRVPLSGEAVEGEAAGEDLARVLSLPYLQGKMEASEQAGVMRYDPDKAYPGLNLYCSGHAPEAVLMDMEGRPLHRWHFRVEAAFPASRPTQDSEFFRRVAMLPGGDLLALYHGTGLIRIDRDSRLLWTAPIAGFNDFFVETDGRILLLGKTAKIIPEINPDRPVLEDSIVELSPQGEVIGSASLLAAFRRPPWDELLATMEDHGDILHSNTVTRLGPDVTGGLFPDDGLLVSLRQVGVIGVLDAAGSEVVWARRGAWKGQHEPVALPGGTMLLFDNKGGPGESSRGLEIDAASGEIVWSYGDGEGESVVSPEGGTIARLPNGNTLITASESGRVIELDRGDEIVWEYLSPHRAGPSGELVATIWEIQRLEPDAADWLIGSTDRGD